MPHHLSLRAAAVIALAIALRDRLPQPAVVRSPRDRGDGAAASRDDVQHPLRQSGRRRERVAEPQGLGRLARALPRRRRRRRAGGARAHADRPRRAAPGLRARGRGSHRRAHEGRVQRHSIQYRSARLARQRHVLALTDAADRGQQGMGRRHRARGDVGAVPRSRHRMQPPASEHALRPHGRAGAPGERTAHPPAAGGARRRPADRGHGRPQRRAVERRVSHADARHDRRRRRAARRCVRR